jgi:hypothetical protein
MLVFAVWLVILFRPSAALVSPAGDMGTEDRKEILVVELYFFEKGG